LSHKTCYKTRRHSNTTDPQHQNAKWFIFTYGEKKKKENHATFYGFTNKIAIRAKNAIQNTLKPHTQMGRYEKIGIY
jgi:hypothetical protein